MLEEDSATLAISKSSDTVETWLEDQRQAQEQRTFFATSIYHNSCCRTVSSPASHEEPKKQPMREGPLDARRKESNGPRAH
jgi:hypothetical protein